jgi:hypothetical protein
MTRTPPTTRKLAPADVHRIRATFDARKALPSDADYVEQFGIARGTVRAIGNRRIYRDVPELQTKEIEK